MVNFPPEANSEERVGGFTRCGRLANFTPEYTAELRDASVAKLERLRRRPRSLIPFIPRPRFPSGCGHRPSEYAGLGKPFPRDAGRASHNSHNPQNVAPLAGSANPANSANQ